MFICDLSNTAQAKSEEIKKRTSKCYNKINLNTQLTT